MLLLVSIASSLVSFFAATLLMHRSEALEEAREVSIALCLAAPLLAWSLTHSVYTLHYAHLY